LDDSFYVILMKEMDYHMLFYMLTYCY